MFERVLLGGEPDDCFTVGWEAKSSIVETMVPLVAAKLSTESWSSSYSLFNPESLPNRFSEWRLCCMEGQQGSDEKPKTADFAMNRAVSRSSLYRYLSPECNTYTKNIFCHYFKATPGPPETLDYSRLVSGQDILGERTS